MTEEAKIILEFTPDACRLMACLAHAVLKQYPDQVRAQEIIDELNLQTTIISKDPEDHGIGMLKNSNKNKYTTASEIALSMEYSFLYHGMAEGSYGG